MKIALNVWARCCSPRDPAPCPGLPQGSVTLVIPLAPQETRRILRTRDRGRASPRAQGGDRPGEPSRRGGRARTELVVKSKPMATPSSSEQRVARVPLDPRSKTASYNRRRLTPLGLAMRSRASSLCAATRPTRPSRRWSSTRKRIRGACASARPGRISRRLLSADAQFPHRAGLNHGAVHGRVARGHRPAGGHVEGVVSRSHDDGHLRAARCGASSSRPGIRISRASRRFRNWYSEPFFGIWVGFFAPANVPAEVTQGAGFRRGSAPLNRPRSARSSGLSGADGLMPRRRSFSGDTRGATGAFRRRREVRTDQVGRRDRRVFREAGFSAALKGPCGTTIEELAWRRSSCSSRTVRSDRFSCGRSELLGASSSDAAAISNPMGMEPAGVMIWSRPT